MKRIEIVDFLKRDYLQYPWSLPTLARRMKFFGIKYIDKTINIDTIKTAVQNELEGPGKLLGYRAMNQKLRTEYKICVPRNLVADVLCDLDPEGVELRNVKRKKKKEKKPFKSDGPGWTYSLDGHDKLMGYQNHTFPLAIYGSLDTFSRKIIFLKVWMSNSDPLLIAKFYIEHLLESNTMPVYLRVDRGTETGTMATIHTYLIDKFENMEDPSMSVIFGPSTSNKIERWWKDLHERMEKYIKQQCQSLLQSHQYDPDNEMDRKILAYIFIPVVQRECDTFCRIWNSNRVRYQPGLELPTGIPEHMFSFPEKYGAENKHINITPDSLIEVGSLAGIEDAPSHYISEDELDTFNAILSNPHNLACKDLADAFIFLKSKHPISSI